MTRKNDISELKIWCNKILPLVYDDSMSYYECICKVVSKLNSVIENQNAISDEIDNEIKVLLNEYRDWVYGAGLENSVSSTLNKWIIDGTFEKILSSLAIPYSNITSNKLSYKLTISDDINSENLENMTADDFYSLYENLANKIDDFKSYTYGSTETGLLLKYYKWECTQITKTNLYNGISTGELMYTDRLYSDNTIIIFTGVHGNEKQSIWSTYNVIKDILTNDKENNIYIRNNFNLLIVPCVNPYGINNNLRRNSNDVDINRNFSYYWDSYESEYKGSTAFSEIESKFCKSILDMYNSKQGHNGTVVLDLHDFTGEDGTYSDYNFFMSVTEPVFKLKCCNLLTYFYNYLTDTVPSAIKSERPILFTQIANAPTLEKYALQLGFKYTALHELRTHISGVQYDSITNRNGFIFIGNLIHEVATIFSADSSPIKIKELREIGCSLDSSLIDIIKAMPKNSSFYSAVPSGNNLSNDMPLYYNGNYVSGYLSIDRGTGDTDVAKMTFVTYGQPRTQMYVSSCSADGVVSNWIELQYFNFYNSAAFDMTVATLNDLIAMATKQQTGNVYIRTLSSDKVLEELPNNVTGNLIIHTTKRGNNIGGIALYINNSGFYFANIYNSGVQSWSKVSTTEL